MQGLALSRHVAGQGGGVIGQLRADGQARHQAHAAGNAELEQAALQQEQQGAVGLQRRGGTGRDLVEHALRITGIHRQAPELGQVFAVVRALQHLLNARIVVNVAHGRHHVGLLQAQHGTERDFHRDLPAVLAQGDEFGLRAHRTAARRALIGAAQDCVALALGCWYQIVDRKPVQFRRVVAE